MTVGNFNEIVGTLGTDTLGGQDLQILYGLNGNDSLTANLGVLGIDKVIFAVGGAGNDTYTVRDNATLFVLENGNSASDSIVATGIGLNGGSAEFLTIEGRHILIRDTTSNQEILLLNATVLANRIESFRFSDGTFTFQQVLNAVNARSLGDFSFTDLQVSGVLDLNRLGINPNAVDNAITTIEQRQDTLVMAQSVGDPHITTFDGLYYDFQAVGDFKLVESLSTGLEIQVRQEKIFGIREDTTVNTAIASTIGDHKIELYAGKTPQLEVNDVLLNLAEGETQIVGPGKISLSSTDDEQRGDGLTYTITQGSGEKIVVDVFELTTNSGSYYINPYVLLYDNQAIEGLLGNFDGIADNDLMLGNGTVIAKPKDPLDLNGAYADTWRLNSSEVFFNDVVLESF